MSEGAWEASKGAWEGEVRACAYLRREAEEAVARRVLVELDGHAAPLEEGMREESARLQHARAHSAAISTVHGALDAPGALCTGCTGRAVHCGVALVLA